MFRAFFESFDDVDFFLWGGLIMFGEVLERFDDVEVLFQEDQLCLGSFSRDLMMWIFCQEDRLGSGSCSGFRRMIVECGFELVFQLSFCLSVQRFVWWCTLLSSRRLVDQTVTSRPVVLQKKSSNDFFSLATMGFTRPDTWSSQKLQK